MIGVKLCCVLGQDKSAYLSSPTQEKSGTGELLGHLGAAGDGGRRKPGVGVWSHSPASKLGVVAILVLASSYQNLVKLDLRM